MPRIERATVLPGAKEFKEGNVNDTFRGQVLLADGSIKHSIIKDLDQKQLCNELLTFVLAREVGLPIPECYLGLARPDKFKATNAPQIDKHGNRLVFVSVDVKVPNITFQFKRSSIIEIKRLLKEIIVWRDLGRLYAFDAWVANIDRHPGNLLFGGNGDFWLIDHGHCFSGPEWKPEDLVSDKEYQNRLSEWLSRFLSNAEKQARSAEVQRFGAEIQSVNVDAASKNSFVGSLMDGDRISAVKEFLTKRVTVVPSHASKALGIPQLI